MITRHSNRGALRHHRSAVVDQPIPYLALPLFSFIPLSLPGLTSRNESGKSAELPRNSRSGCKLTIQHPAFWGQPMTAEQRFNVHNTFPLPIGASHRAEPVSHTQ